MAFLLDGEEELGKKITSLHSINVFIPIDIMIFSLLGLWLYYADILNVVFELQLLLNYIKKENFISIEA